MASSGPNSPGTLANDATVGTIAWTNPGNAAASDNVYATSSSSGAFTTNYLKATNFGFSIPVGATIDGILVEVEKSGNGTTTKFDNSLKLVKGGVIGGTDKTTVDTWPLSDTYVSSGSSSDLWGETWTAADINASDFGFSISAKNTGSSAQTIYLDHIRITVYYTLTAGTMTNVQSMTNVATLTI